MHARKKHGISVYKVHTHLTGTYIIFINIPIKSVSPSIKIKCIRIVNIIIYENDQCQLSKYLNKCIQSRKLSK